MKQLKIHRKITKRENPALDKLLQEMSSIPLLKPDEEIALAEKAQAGDEAALHRLIIANLRFVVSVAKQYQNQGIPLNDLINHGILGLIKAVKKFDFKKGFKLISYSVCWIRQVILQALAEEAKAVRMPLNRVGRLNKINKEGTKIEQANERDATPGELADALQMNNLEISSTMVVSRRPTSLNTPFAEGEDSTPADTLEEDKSNSPEKNLMSASLKTELSKLISELNVREKSIIISYFGIGIPHPMTLEEIGKKNNLTRERVRQIKEKVLSKLRNKAHHRNLFTYIGM